MPSQDYNYPYPNNDVQAVYFAPPPYESIDKDNNVQLYTRNQQPGTGSSLNTFNPQFISLRSRKLKPPWKEVLLASLCAMCCCLPCGIPALILAICAKLYKQKNFDNARVMNKISCHISEMAICAGCSCWLLIIIWIILR